MKPITGNSKLTFVIAKVYGDAMHSKQEPTKSTTNRISAGWRKSR